MVESVTSRTASKAMGYSHTVVVVLPARNEETTVGEVLRAIPRRIGSSRVIPLVIDDGSEDATSAVARAFGALVVRHTINLGVGAATRTGLLAAQELDADTVVTMDADGQHDPSDIESLVQSLAEGDYDVVIGNRMLDPEGMPLSRIVANWLLNAITLVVYRGSVSDSQSGFKCLSRRALQRIELKADGYEICSEIIGEVVSKGLKYKSVPVKVVYTGYSRAKGQHFLNGINIILQLLTRMMRRV